MHDVVSAGLVFHSSLEQKSVYSNLICPEWETYFPKRLLTQHACQCLLKGQFIPSTGGRCAHVCVLPCVFGVQAFTLGWDGVIKLIDLCTRQGCVALPGGLISMDMCGNQKTQRSIICTLQHEAHRCGMPVGKISIVGEFKDDLLCRFFCSVWRLMRIRFKLALFWFFFLKQGCKALLSGWCTQALFGVQRSTLLIVTMLLNLFPTVSHQAACLLWFIKQIWKQSVEHIPQSPAQTCELLMNNIFVGSGNYKKFV